MRNREKKSVKRIRRADREVSSGHYIRHDAMRAWLLSWGTTHELPPPKCVCGKDHGDQPLPC